MEKVILLNDRTNARQEISELFEHKGYSPLFAGDLTELIGLMNTHQCSKSFICVKSLSDIKLLQTLRSLYQQMEISLIIPPHLQEIIDLLKNNNYNIIDDITNV